jgi:hypothetical protein
MKSRVVLITHLGYLSGINLHIMSSNGVNL